MMMRVVLCVLLLPVLTGGCVELGFIVQEAMAGASTGSPGGGETDGEDSPSGPGTTDEVPVVRLSVSNSNPMVNEEVVFTCRVVDGDAAEVTFAFQPADARLSVNSRIGTASYIVDQTDVGVELTVTCTATNAAGRSEPSNRQSIIATE
jgi:hypothetical protein